MAINFHPHAGTVLICDFRGYEEPEICKKRPVVVITPRLPYRSGLATVVPISLTAPKHDQPYVVRLSKNYHPEECDELPCWAKCDLVASVRMQRLDRFKTGRRKWETPRMSGEDLQAVRLGVVHGLGLGGLLKWPDSTK
ncbi:type II toxin-antitoxin system PemK/MazF family toxin [Afifella sp. H1R]|uniref:type II toxin-antitoxin system PemK/MazF family toxin n=1 Tax=Afifella sp. H1R TaxID=2908841 RepID=UPI00351D8E68